MSTKWQVFICYRRVDGSDTAFWLYKALHGRSLPTELTESEVAPELDVYFDQASPAVGDWHQVHKPALEKSRALIVVCTPGLYGRIDGQDWVHDEIDWWLSNRSVAPIIVDPTGEGGRWLPDVIKQRWPNTQRVNIDADAWKNLLDSDKASHEELVVQRILGGISASEAKTRREDAIREHARNIRLRRSFWLATGASLFASIALGATMWFAFEAHEGKKALNRQFALSLIEQAEDAWARNETNSASVLAARALTYDRSNPVKNRYHALHKWMDQEYEQALQHVEQTLALDYQHAIEIAHLPQLAERLARVRSAQRSFDNFLALGAKLRKAQYDSVLRFKGLTHRIETSMRTRFLERHTEKGTLDQLRVAQSKISRLAYRVPEDDEHRIAWTENYVAAARQLAAAYRSVLPKELPTAPSLQWRELQQRLRNNEALVDFLLYRNRYAAWILKSTGDPIRYELGEASGIEKDAKTFRELITSNDPIWRCSATDELNLHTRGIIPFDEDSGEVKFGEPIGSPVIEVTHDNCSIAPKAQQIRRQVWEPVAHELGEDIDTVFIVPDAVLATIPFGALPSRSPNTFLFEEKLIVYLASAHDLPGELTVQSSGKGVILMGGADYGSDATQVDPKSFQRNLTILPGTLQEIETIEKGLRKLKGVRPLVTYTDSAANERAFRQNAEGRRIIHLATHGWTDYLPTESRIDPELASLPHNIEGYIATLNPLLRAGVALSPTETGIIDGQVDGILTALEVSALDLRGVELVVLSGCDTLGTRNGGYSAVGLFRAFREAGASSVVASLYPVPDVETADLMVHLYENLVRDEMPAVALRDAAKEMKDKGWTPFTWAGFVAYAPSGVQLSVKGEAGER